MNLKKIIPGLLLLLAELSAYPQTISIPRPLVKFSTSDPALQKLYDAAEAKIKWNISDFGKYRVLVEGAQYKNVWLETQPMGGYMYAKRDPEIARNNTGIFMDFQREDGRLPGMISYRDNQIIPHYGWFQGYCFPMPAFELYFLTGKDKTYLEKLYTTLERFDSYLWKVRDSDHDGCLETWGVFDTGEDESTRFGESPSAWPFEYPPSRDSILAMSKSQLKKACFKSEYDFSKDFPVPIESMDIMSYSYSGRQVLSLISRELGNGKEAYWKEKADEVRQKIKEYLWNHQKHACFDRDKSNKTMDILLHNNLRCMYYGSFDQEMADEFIRYHLLNPREFWTPMPLPSIAVNDPYFRNDSENDWSGQPESLTFQRSICALENYGHYAELTMIGTKFLKVVGDSLKFVQQFDPFKAVISSPRQDGYGPCILATLEFISRLFGIHITQDKIYWSCLDNGHRYDYSQKWGDKFLEMKTQGNQVFCSINGKEIFSFTKGARLISDLDGNLTGATGIETTRKKIDIDYKHRDIHLTVLPNSEYRFDGKFRETRKVEFCERKFRESGKNSER